MNKTYYYGGWLLFLAIIGLWLFSFSNNLIEKAKNVMAIESSVELSLSIEGYIDEYENIPSELKQTTNTSNPSKLLSTLLGKAPTYNPQRINFFSPQFTERNVELLQDAQLYDPWGNGYIIAFDNDPEYFPEGFQGRYVKVFSSGPDGKHGTPKHDKDNIRSWRASD